MASPPPEGDRLGRTLTVGHPTESVTDPTVRRAFRPPELSVRLLLAVIATLLLLVGLLAVRHFALQVVSVSGESMEPVLQSGDRVLLDKITYRLRPIRRGDVVVVEPDSDLLDVPDQNVKRVIAFEGENVVLEEGRVFIDGEPLDEPYTETETASPTCAADNPCVVPDGHIFVLGDNRVASTDSRTFGTVPADRIAGLVVARLWPPGRVGLL